MPSIDKVFGPYPFAHRAWAHDGQCKLIHGHNWTFTVRFSGNIAAESPCGFLIDFGKFDELKTFLEEAFDHTFVIAASDPLIDEFARLEQQGACKLVILAGTSSEAIAAYVFRVINSWLKRQPSVGWSNAPVLTEVNVRESDKNSATAYSE